ncbi:MAG: hypothetical protein IJ371_02395 [Clostridia bacterium]|nr:hypothetical protein [Clostridia bacterium]
MKTCNKLVRDNVTEILKTQGYKEIKGKKLKGEKYKAKLYSLFLQEYKETLNTDEIAELHVHYADMLEVIRTLMITTKTNIKEIDFEKGQPMEWYQRTLSFKSKLNTARIDLLQKFDELLQIKTEAVKDQLGDILHSFRQLVEANNISFIDVEKVRRIMFKKLGGFSQGVYLVSVSQLKTHAV